MRKTKTLIMSMVAAVALLSSCSRQIASTTSMNKMMSGEVLASNKIQPQNNIAPCLPETNMPQQTAENKPAVSRENRDKAVRPVRVKYRPALFAKNFKKDVINDVKKQSAAIMAIGLNHNVVSYSKTQHTQGYLGIAGICLIVAIVLGILGFTTSHWFWDLCVILLVAAVVFFLLYFIAKAASPKSE